MSATVTRDAEGTITGNSFDKYGSTNPVFRRIMNRFEHNLGNLFESIDPASVLDVGCGEGVLTHKWATARPQTRVVGFDLEDPAIQAEWAQRAISATVCSGSGTCSRTSIAVASANSPTANGNGSCARRIR